MLSSLREEDGLRLGCLETNGVAVRPPKASGGTSLQLASRIINVGTLNDLSVPHEAVGSLDEALIQSGSTHLAE